MWPTVYVERPPWPSASFPSVKALAGFVKRRRQQDTRALVCVVTLRTYEDSARETEDLPQCARWSPSTYVYIDEKLTPRDLSTDNIVLKCISHRSAAGHYVKSILLYVDIVRQTGCSYLLTRIDKFLQGARQWIYSLDTYLKIFLIYLLKDRNTNISPNQLEKRLLVSRI